MNKQDAFPVGLATRGAVRPTSLSPVMLPLDPRPRCERHGMLTLADTRCPRCIKEDESRMTRRTLFIVATVALGILLTLIGARAFLIGRDLVGSAASTSEAAPTDARLVVYTTSSCPYCRKAKSWLESQQISFQEKNVGDDDDARKEWADLGGRGVPMFAIDGKVVQRGYDPSGRQLLKELQDRGLR